MSYFAGGLAIALALTGAAAFYQYGQAERARRELSEYVSRAELAAAQEAARRAKAHQEIVDAESIRRREAEAVAARLRAGSDRLRDQLAAIRDGAPAALGGAAAGADSRVLADLLEQCRSRVVALVAEADATRAAGTACVRAYESLRSPP